MKLTFNNIQNSFAQSQAMQMKNTLPPELLNRDRQAGKRKTPYSNLFWFDFWQQTGKKYPITEKKVYLHVDIEGNEIDRESHRDIYIYIHTWINYNDHKPTIQYTIRFRDKEIRQSIKNINSNSEVTEAWILQQVLKHVNKNHLFVKGAFRTVQLALNKSKEATLKYIKQVYQYAKDNKQTREAAVLNLIEKRFNINVPFGLFRSEDKAYLFCANWVKNNGKPEDIKYLERFNPFSLLDSFDGDIDEAEALLNEHLRDTREDIIYI